MDNTVGHFYCNLGKNHRCDPADTYLKQRLYCTVTCGAAERNRIFPPLWCTAVDPEKSAVDPVKSAVAGYPGVIS